MARIRGSIADKKYRSNIGLKLTKVSYGNLLGIKMNSERKSTGTLSIAQRTGEETQEKSKNKWCKI